MFKVDLAKGAIMELKGSQSNVPKMFILIKRLAICFSFSVFPLNFFLNSMNILNQHKIVFWPQLDNFNASCSRYLP